MKVRQQGNIGALQNILGWMYAQVRQRVGGGQNANRLHTRGTPPVRLVGIARA